MVEPKRREPLDPSLPRKFYQNACVNRDFVAQDHHRLQAPSQNPCRKILYPYLSIKVYCTPIAPYDPSGSCAEWCSLKIVSVVCLLTGFLAGWHHCWYPLYKKNSLPQKIWARLETHEQKKPKQRPLGSTLILSPISITLLRYPWRNCGQRRGYHSEFLEWRPHVSMAKAF